MSTTTITPARPTRRADSTRPRRTPAGAPGLARRRQAPTLRQAVARGDRAVEIRRELADADYLRASREAPTRVLPPIEAEPRPVPRRTAEATELRLTRRGRATLLLASLTLVLSAGIALGAGSSATDTKGHPAATSTYVVAPGDTLWGIAGEVSGSARTGEVVDQIERMNGLDSAMLEVGQELVVPAAG